MNLSVGTRVRRIKSPFRSSGFSGGWTIEVGETGTVAALASDATVVVRWDSHPGDPQPARTTFLALQARPEGSVPIEAWLRPEQDGKFFSLNVVPPHANNPLFIMGYSAEEAAGFGFIPDEEAPEPDEPLRRLEAWVNGENGTIDQRAVPDIAAALHFLIHKDDKPERERPSNPGGNSW